jgi:glyoxylase-like metal-dependent hydrolase (beta-lactamase superfamily II)
VINSHRHNDHIRGNQVFKPHSIIVSTNTIRELIAETEPAQIASEKEYAPARLARLKKNLITETDAAKRQAIQMWTGYFEGMVNTHPCLKMTLPDLTFNDTLIFSGTERTAVLWSYKNAHTENDLVLYIPEDQILFTGDLVFNHMHPYLPDGNLLGWSGALRDLSENDINIVVPGHGDVCGVEGIHNMINYFRSCETIVAALYAQNKQPDEVRPELLPDPYKRWLFPDFFMMNIRFLFTHNK